MAYLGEDVTMIQHQLQAGALATAAGQHDALVVAALAARHRPHGSSQMASRSRCADDAMRTTTPPGRVGCRAGSGPE